MCIKSFVVLAHPVKLKLINTHTVFNINIKEWTAVIYTGLDVTQMELGMEGKKKT